MGSSGTSWRPGWELVDEDKLQRALAPVRQYFSGEEVNVDTVLAAYLRSRGLPTSGQAWEAAKRAMSRGVGFKEAVMLAASRLTPGINSAPVTINRLSTPSGGCSLDWFPKQFSPGEIQGVPQSLLRWS